MTSPAAPSLPVLQPPGSSSLIDLVTLGPRILYAVCRTIAAFLVFSITSIFYKNSCDPERLTNKKIPIILIHGSGSNQRQWDVFRRFLKNCGHVFSLNLNEKALVNDSKTMNEYAKERLAAKIDSLKKRYLEEAHVNLNEVILVGHSMGGLVAGEYAVNCASDVKVKAIIALQTPWQGGSCLANLVYSPSNKPGGAFTSNNQMTKTLRAQVLKKHEDGDLQLYTFSSTFDPFVRPSSSALPIPQENQMISKVHGHYSPMMDPWLARSIQDRWIVPLSSADLPTYSSSGSSSNIARAFCESSQPRAAASS